MRCVPGFRFFAALSACLLILACASPSGSSSSSTPALESISIQGEGTSYLVVLVGSVTKIAVNVVPAAAASSVVWSADQSTFVDMSPSGVLTALAPGNTFIRAESPDGTITSSISVQVVKATWVAAGAEHSLVLLDSGDLFFMGSSQRGQAGRAAAPDRRVPEYIGYGYDALHAGSYYSVARQDGSIRVTGANDQGQLGIGTTDDSFEWRSHTSTSTLVSGLTNLLIAFGGELSGSGDNGSGQLGIGSTTNQTTLGTLLDGGIYAAWGGVNHSLMLKNDGSLWAMGDNTFGQFGNGTTTGSQVPVRVFEANMELAAAGDRFSLFLNNQGLWAAGKNSSGQLGTGNTNDVSTPVQVLTDTVNSGDDVHSLVVGKAHSVIIVGEERRLFAAGDNTYGQLGTGSFAPETSFREVLTGLVSAVSAGEYHTLIIMANGSVWAMGRNNHGQLGIGSTQNANVPTRISLKVYKDL